MTTVRVGEGASYDDKLWSVAHKLGLDRQLGIDLNLIPFTSFPLTQLRRGDVDVIFSCQVCAATSYSNFPTYRDFLITNQYKAFVVVGRRGETTFSQLLQQDGGNMQSAKQQFVQSLKGKTIATWKSADLSLIQSLLSQGGLTTGAVKILDFPDLNTAADAFINGNGDYYVGALNQQAKMLYSPDLKGRFVVAAPFSAFGPGGLWYSTEGTTQTWLAQNHETALRLLAIWYRATRYLRARPGEVIPVVAQTVKTITGGTFASTITKQIMFNLNYFPTWQEAKTYVYGASSPTSEAVSVGYNFKHDQQQGQVPENLRWQTFETEKQYFTEMLARPDLMKYVNAPLK